jgi:hypothetical protein
MYHTSTMSTGITLALCLQVPTLALGLQVSTPSVAIYRKLEGSRLNPLEINIKMRILSYLNARLLVYYYQGPVDIVLV